MATLGETFPLLEYTPPVPPSQRESSEAPAEEDSCDCAMGRRRGVGRDLRCSLETQLNAGRVVREVGLGVSTLTFRQGRSQRGAQHASKSFSKTGLRGEGSSRTTPAQNLVCVGRGGPGWHLRLPLVPERKSGSARVRSRPARLLQRGGNPSVSGRGLRLQRHAGRPIAAHSPRARRGCRNRPAWKCQARRTRRSQRRREWRIRRSSPGPIDTGPSTEPGEVG